MEFAKATSKKPLVFFEFMCDIPRASTKSEPVIHFQMNSCSWLALPNLGMDIFLFISRHNIVSLSCNDHRRIHHHVKYYLILNDTLYRHGIDSILRRCLTHERLNMCWMISTLEHVAVIYLGWLQPRKSFTLVIFGPWSLNISMKRLKNSHHVSSFIQRSSPTLLYSTPSFPLALSPNGGLILCIVILPQLGIVVTSL